MSRLKPHNIYLVFATCCILPLCFITPPFNVPDESGHFFRAYQISEGQIKGVRIEKDGKFESGGYLPKSLDTVSLMANHLAFHPENKFTKRIWSVYSAVPLEPENRKFIMFSNTVLYHPFTYIPQAAAVWMARSFEMRPAYMIYFVRVFAAICSIAIIYCALRLTPCFRWLMLVVACLPITLFQVASVSADSLTISCCFLITAFLFGLIFHPRRMIGRKQIGLLIGTSVILGWIKIAYGFIIALILLIPSRRFQNSKVKWPLFIGCAVLTALTVLSWSQYVADIYSSLKPVDNIDPRRQLDFVLSNRNAFASLVLEQYWHVKELILKKIIGILGWVDTVFPDFYYVFFWIFLFVNVFFSSSPKQLGGLSRLYILSLCVFELWFLALLQYMNWNPVGAKEIEGLGGRYLIPFLPILFVAFTGLLKNLKRWIAPSYIPYLQSLNVLILGVASIYALCTVYTRYYLNTFIP